MTRSSPLYPPPRLLLYLDLAPPLGRNPLSALRAAYPRTRLCRPPRQSLRVSSFAAKPPLQHPPRPKPVVLPQIPTFLRRPLNVIPSCSLRRRRQATVSRTCSSTSRGASSPDKSTRRPWRRGRCMSRRPVSGRVSTCPAFPRTDVSDALLEQDRVVGHDACFRSRMLVVLLECSYCSIPLSEALSVHC